MKYWRNCAKTLVFPVLARASGHGDTSARSTIAPTILTVGSIAAIVGACLFSVATFGGDKLPLSAAEIDKLGIELTTPKTARRLSAASASARVVVPPASEFVVSAPQSGLVARLLVASGDSVEQGQVLAEVQSAGFMTLQSEYLESASTNKLAQSQLARDQQMFDEGIIAKRRLQETQSSANEAATRVAQSQRLLAIAGMNEDAIKELGVTRQLQDSMLIRSPIDGVVLKQVAHSGQRVDSMEPLFRVADLDKLWLEIQVAQERIDAIEPGMKVSVADCAVDQPAEVILLGRQVDPDTQSVIVRAALTKPGHKLRPGQFASVKILSAKQATGSETVLTVPSRALIHSGGLCFVFVRSGDGFEVRTVETFGEDNQLTYVAGALKAQDSIAVSGLAALKALWLSSKAEKH
ncbi:MAG: efflux RND transporter periplasmic adaptor subunit [Pseudomonadales bacterium]